ncbi:hypothetical protein L2D14_02295 [Thalassospiraceae bacterium LMO-JJ14]|nr:hypothetical protein L2D14_02295 [Thalassospiraceae bacterium LMO-JJ14]
MHRTIRASLNEDFIRSARLVERDQYPEIKKFFDYVLENERDNLSAMYGHAILALRISDTATAVRYFHEIAQRCILYPEFLGDFFQDFQSYEQLREVADAYIQAFPEEPFGYILKLVGCYNKNDMDTVRETFDAYYRRGRPGLHFQPSTIASIFDARRGGPRVSVAPQTPDQSLTDTISDAPARTESAFTGTYSVLTMPGEAVGLDGAVLNGQIEGATQPTQYYFRYGTAPDELTQRTPPRQMPPGRNGRLIENGANMFRRMTAFSLTVRFVETGNDAIGDGVAMRFEGPFGKDRNHREGIGVIDLLMGWTSAVHLRGAVPEAYESETFPKPAYPGEAMDLRDAGFSVTYRVRNLDAKKFFPVAWVHGATGEAMFPAYADNCAAWARTGDLGGEDFINDDTWHRAEFTLSADSRAWSFCGNNVEETNASMERYCYHPIGDVLRENRAGNICLCFVCGDEMDPPVGDIDIASLALAYRSYSLLGPGQQAALVRHPANSGTDPGLLTNGWIGAMGHCWQSGAVPSEAQDFIWKFREDAAIRSIRLHQHPLWPARQVSLATSADGADFKTLWDGTMRDVPEDIALWPTGSEPVADDSRKPFNLAESIVFDAPGRGRYLRLRIASGYRDAHWGLDAIEVFGDAPAFMPSAEKFTLSEDLAGLAPGALFAQLVTENASGRTQGPVIEIARPDDVRPLLSDPAVIRRCGSSVFVAFRTNAMGAWGTLSGKLRDADGEEIVSAPVSIGKQQAARTTFLCFEGIDTGRPYKGEAVATTAHGDSAPCLFTIDAVDSDNTGS